VQALTLLGYHRLHRLGMACDQQLHLTRSPDRTRRRDVELATSWTEPKVNSSSTIIEPISPNQTVSAARVRNTGSSQFDPIPGSDPTIILNPEFTRAERSEGSTP